MTDINSYVNNLLNHELNKDTSNKLINYIDEDINFNYNSFKTFLQSPCKKSLV